MEPTNHPFRKENDLNQTSMIMFQPLIFRGVIPCMTQPTEVFFRGSNVLACHVFVFGVGGELFAQRLVARFVWLGVEPTRVEKYSPQIGSFP